MKLPEAKILATTLIISHGLSRQGWKLRLDNAKLRFGNCNYRHKTISLSKTLIRLNDIDKVKDTILHEIAHALAGREAHHYKKWRAVAVSIGCNGRRCYDNDTITPPAKWLGTCLNGHTTKRMLRKKLSCHKCSPVYNENYLFEYKLNPEGGD